MPILATLWEAVWRSAHALEPPTPQRQQQDVCVDEEEATAVDVLGQDESEPAGQLLRKRRVMRCAGSDEGKGGGGKQQHAGGMPLLMVVVAATDVSLPLLLRHARCAAAPTRPPVTLHHLPQYELHQTFTLGTLLSQGSSHGMRALPYTQAHSEREAR